MIQRIQSIYLLLAAILMAVTAFSPLASLSNGGKFALLFFSSGVGLLPCAFPMLEPTWGVLFFAVLGFLIPLINIFLFKKRKLQMKIGTITSLIIIFFYITTFTYFQSIIGKGEFTFISIEYGIFLPLLALLFNVLAILKIKKDDKLVRSLDRIR